MSPEEKPQEHPDAESVQSSANDSSIAAENSADIDQREPVDAILVEQTQPQDVDPNEPILAETAEFTDFGAGIDPSGIAFAHAPPIAGNLENMSAKGGAIGALVLGIWCVLGSFITNWSIINGGLGLLMGFWGLTSRKPKIAWLGIALCVLGILMSLVQVSELVNTYLKAVDENP